MKILNVTEANEYLNFLDGTLNNLIVNRQIYLDFYNALTSQKANTNDFIKWVLRNYYVVLIMSLCKITDVATQDDDRTLIGFLELCKIPENFEVLKNARLNKKIYVQNLETGKQSELDISCDIQQIFHNIKIDDDKTKIIKIHNQLKPYRNKRIAHLTITKVNFEHLNFKVLHKMIDDIEDIIKRYYHLLGIAVINDALKSPYLYGNFQLTLR